MNRAIAVVSVAAVLVALFMLLPFLPGEHLPVVLSLYVLGTAIGIGGVLLVPAGIVWLILDRKRAIARSAPLLLIALPLVSLAMKFLALPGAEARSRERAMRNAAPMIAAIEAYRARVGQYPISLLSELGDYDTGVMGIPRYLYEPSGTAYNLIFEQPSHVLGTREFVIYNPLGQQNFSAHDADLLELSPADIDRQRGYYASRDAGQPNWKRFLFD